MGKSYIKHQVGEQRMCRPLLSRDRSIYRPRLHKPDFFSHAKSGKLESELIYSYDLIILAYLVIRNKLNPYHVKLTYLNIHPLEVVSR